jgi:hypothetical protein
VKAKGGADAFLFDDITICDIILTSSGTILLDQNPALLSALLSHG